MAKHNELGVDGEKVAAEYLVSKGYKIEARNFRRPYGEIDIVARETSGLLVFVEVKTVSHEMSPEGYRPEDNVHPMKLRRMGNVIQSYLMYKRHDGDWRFDVIAVYLNPVTKQAKIRHTADIVIGS